MDEVTGCEGKDAITERPAGLVEMPERLLAHDAVNGDSALLLKGADGLLDALIEDGTVDTLVDDVGTCWPTGVGHAARVEQVEPHETLSDIGDRCSGVPSTEEGSCHATARL